MSIKANKDNAVFISNAYLQEDGYKASATITYLVNPVDGNNITLNGTVFTYRTTPAVANDVALGGTISIAIDNLLTEALPATATYTKVGTNQIFIEYKTIGVAGNAYTISSNFLTVPSNLSGGSNLPDSDWVDNTPTIDYKLPMLDLGDGSDYKPIQTTSTALVAYTPVAENDLVKFYNSTDGLVEGSLGTATTTITDTVNIHDIFGDGSCVATYKLDGNANDLGGNYNGTASNVTYSTGKYGQCGVFNGTTAGIDLPNTATSSITNQTSVSVWVKCTTPAYDSFIFNSRYSNATHGMYINTSGKLCSNNYNTGGNIISSGPSIVTNLWVHIVFVYNNGDWKYYVNKTLDSSLNRTFTAFTQTLSGGNTIGKLDTEANWFNGSIDQVRIFNRALTPAEITVLYDEQITKYTADISSLGLTVVPTKAYFDKSVSIVTDTADIEANIDIETKMPTTEESDTYDNVNEKFIKTYNKIEQQGRAMKYKISSDSGVEITKVSIPMSREP